MLQRNFKSITCQQDTNFIIQVNGYYKLSDWANNRICLLSILHPEIRMQEITLSRTIPNFPTYYIKCYLTTSSSVNTPSSILR